MSPSPRSRLVSSLTVLVTSASLAAPAVADGRTHETVDTVKAWNGQTRVYPLDPDGTQTYGQTLTAPTDATLLRSFRFVVRTVAPIGFRGYLFAWDAEAQRAEGPALWAGRAVHRTGTDEWSALNLHIDARLQPGATYVVLLTTIGVPQPTAQARAVFAQPQRSDVYPGGAFVFFNNDDFGALTTEQWDGGAGDWLGEGGDLAFRAVFMS